jgi:hypothetical protein
MTLSMMLRRLVPRVKEHFTKNDSTTSDHRDISMFRK